LDLFVNGYLTTVMALSNKKINCFKCKYFFVTWEPEFPRGCHAMNFKGKEFPSTVVKRNSGKPCLLFEPKKIKPSN